MENILDKIVAYKKKEVEEKQSLYPVKLLEKSIYFNAQPVSLEKYILREDLDGVIAEFKRRSPSKGMINAYAKSEKVTLAYMQAGASALSVLTDENFFGGRNSDLETARKINYCPILRKDFIVDEYQVIEARSIGADAILLIAAILTRDEIQKLSSLAFSLGMEVLLELHDESEIDKVTPGINLIGVNNRDLKTFNVNLDRSMKMAAILSGSKTLIAESGISEPETIISLRDAGFSGFLIGENFMKTSDPGKACAGFIAKLKTFTFKKQQA
ncbi:MAG TPA: indole-3-glycerol phosphate synthase TrpC [Bacteroidia bacterium]|jgi:indole-3-glycerol phosphate synthase|nr:indole-3-glycerol phosphate synthase TrpC [Bacteroidia bacterium]